MSLKLHNTLSGSKEQLTAQDNEIKMYVCGITPYSASHIGHAMFSIVFDVVRRYLEFKGYTVKHIQNFTDVDDKMIQAASDQGITVKELGDRNIEAYLQETDELNVLRAHVYPKATEEIPNIVKMIQGLIDEDYAYCIDGDVYFRVHKDDDYGKLSHRTLESLMAGARLEINEEKENAADFALWKGQKPGEPAWGSPWGPGRPGWHIECSAMSITYLGEIVDIHGGGQDLIFPHHENEIAQSESYTHKEPFVRFWLHNGLLRLGEDKMSKSLGNIISVRDALDKFSSDAIRLFFLNSHYRNPLVYSEENIGAQERAAERLRNAVNVASPSNPAKSLDAFPFRDRFIEAMDDDLNTPRALASLFDLTHEINRAREAGQDILEAQQILRELSLTLGLTLEAPKSSSIGDAEPFIQLLVDTRTKLRAARQFELADNIRDNLTELGVTLEDSAQGTGWSYRAP
jgi:cysteinyl-tRNA synthetase